MDWTRFLVSLLNLAVVLPASISQVREAADLHDDDNEIRAESSLDRRNAMLDRTKRWADGLVPYEIQTNDFHYGERSTILLAMKELEDHSTINGKKCILFKPHNGERQFIKFVSGTGCHTPVGRGHGVTNVTLGRGCLFKGVVMHEILHALGFWHEHNRPDRDDYVNIFLNNVDRADRKNFDRMTYADIDTLNQPYDFGSIMHYDPYAFALNPNLPTIQAKQRGIIIGQRDGLSRTDREKLLIYYECRATPHTTTSRYANLSSTEPTVSSSDLCTFENGWCGWTNLQAGDNTDWVPLSGPTPTLNTGPDGDHTTGNGTYLYVDAGAHTNQSAILQSSPQIPGTYCLGFWYLLFGVDQASLSVYLNSGQSHRLPLHIFKGNQPKAWRFYSLAINSPAAPFFVQIEARTGNGPRSDVALDDVILRHGSCSS